MVSTVDERIENGVIFSETPTIEEALQLGIDAINRGDMKLGTEILEWVIEWDPENQVAWLWMACTVDDEPTKRKYYLKINSST